MVLTGNLNRIEVWSKAKWSENNDYDDMDAIAEDMQEMGIVDPMKRRRLWNLNINPYY